jgi:hypothetical protein
MPVHKVTLTITVLAHADSQDHVLNAYSNMSLSQIEEAIEFGEDVGMVELTSVETVPDDEIKDELIALGNDGTFFDCYLGLLDLDETLGIDPAK